MFFQKYALELISGTFLFLTPVLFFLLFRVRKNKQLENLKALLSEKELNAAKADVLLQEKERRLAEMAAANASLQQEKDALGLENAKLRSDAENQQKYMEERFKDLAENKDELLRRFQNMSNELLKMQTVSFESEQKKSLDALLQPFKQQIADFRSKIEKVHADSLESKGSFERHLNSLMEMNNALSKDAQNLTDALRGNKKLQGNWGEFQLERVLEISGLQKGINYSAQENHKDENDRNRRPDIIVYMPDNRNIIIDSKVSLNDYMDYVAAGESSENKQALLLRHVECLKRHILGLSSKEYQKLLKEKSLDYVIIFIPVESAYIDAVKYDSSLYDFAYRHHIVIATPSSLLPILRTVENLWQLEKQNKNVQEIASVGGLLFDKIVNFSEDMKKIGSALDSSRKSYDAAVSKLTEGRGNALSLANRLKELGAKTNKELSLEYDSESV